MRICGATRKCNHLLYDGDLCYHHDLHRDMGGCDEKCDHHGHDDSTCIEIDCSKGCDNCEYRFLCWTERR